jgi:TolB-like protein/DNA-binding winged helix-turn-helix (wHTH) protein
MPAPESPPTLRFGEFELDLAAYQLRRDGRPVKLGRQPMELLILLVERRGQLVTRADIVARLWGPDVFVDVEMGVNSAISKVRQALRDAPDTPRFLETVPGKGYRFLAPIDDSAPAPPAAPDLTPEPPEPAAPIPRGRPRPAFVPIVALVVVAAVTAVAAFALWRARAAATPTGVAIAVLPFVNLDGDVERDYLAAGLTDETSASLARIDPAHLTVKGRTQPYRNTTKTAAEIGRELSVDYLVESSIRTEGSRVRMIVSLLRVGDEAHVWSQRFDRESASLLSLQAELSTAIAEQIRLTLSPEGLRGVQRRQTASASAYDAYLRGRHQQHRRTADGNRQAIGFLRQAVADDPRYALAWSDLSFVYAASTLNGDAPPAAVAGPAREAGRQAVTLDASLPEAQTAYGYERWLLGWDWPAAEVALRRAVELDPSHVAGHRHLGHLLSQRGRPAEATASMARARELDPLDALTWALSAQVAYQGRDLPAATTFARRAIALDPQLWIGYMQLAQAHDAAGEPDLALEVLADAERLADGNSKVSSLRGYVLARRGRTAAARVVLASLTAPSPARYVPPHAAALVHAGLGEREAMFDALERAFAAHDVHLMYLPVDPKWDPFRTDPRFVSLLARCRFDVSR